VKSAWRDGERTRAVELESLGGGRWRVRVDAVEFELAVEAGEDGRLRLLSGGDAVAAEVTAAGERRFVGLGSLEFVLERVASTRARTGGGPQDMTAPMPGVVTRVLVKPGDAVVRGQPLVAIEAMKMEHLVRAPRDGRVRAVHASAGAMVQGDVVLVELDAEAAPA
jgi:biotin carboxyl carrier protein